MNIDQILEAVGYLNYAIYVRNQMIINALSIRDGLREGNLYIPLY